MKVIYAKLPSRKKACVATIGVFDGVHLGHQFLLRKVRQEALRGQLVSLAITFDVPPQRLAKIRVTPKNISLGLLTDLEDKKNIFESLGIDCLWLLKTNAKLLELSSEQFLRYLMRYFLIKKIIVGEDFRFGYQGHGSRYTLQQLAGRYQFAVSVIEKRRKNGIAISSSVVREYVKRAAFGSAREMLGRDYCLKGKIIRGSGYGMTLGFPTANIHPFDYIVPSSGVYAAIAKIEDSTYVCALNIGKRPTVSNTEDEVIEAHLINFSGNILGKTIKIFFLEKIRAEKKFVSQSVLKEAINHDVNYISEKYHRHPGI
ncbi:MAG: bifunctional riboflavin kinase/FAD synthetase [Candidatus Omnitrophota bacterium]